MKNSLEARSVILHDIYRSLDTGLKYITLPYTKNNWFKFGKLIDKSGLENIDSNNKDQIKLKSLLVIFILGNDNIISTSFKTIIELINKSDDAMKANRTELVFNMGNKLFKFANYKLNKLHNVLDSKDNGEINKVKEIDQFNQILKLLPYDKIFEIINGYSETDKFEIGDTVMNILETKTSLIDRKLVTQLKNREVFISISEDYIKKLNIFCIDVTQLPMLVIPNKPDVNGKYLPYIHGEISHIYNTFDSVVKHKHDLRDQVENQYVLNHTINYLNKTAFTINKDVLDFILLEWYNENSKFFNGLNKEQVISKSDSEEIRNSKQSHNSKYWRYSNTINIAKVYRNSIFYLPTFADFRGRVYTLTQYLSYQGDDLCRSLLLFANDKENEPLSEKGFDYLLFYLANLYGKTNLSYEDRIQWSKENVITLYDMFLNDTDKFDSEVLPKLKEPFQFISIMFATVRCLVLLYNGKEVILNNPILFDASCNGLQHLSAMTREVDIAVKTNLVSLPDSPEMRNDFYLYAATLVQAELDKCDNDNLKQINISREIVKKTVMTIPYNITLFGVKEQMKEHFEVYKEGKKIFYKVEARLTKNSEPLYLIPNELNKLGTIVYEALIHNLPSLRVLSEYLEELLTILLKLNEPVIWITPSGLKISLSNVKYDHIRSSSSLLPYGKPVTISIPTQILNTRRIKTSFMPNLVHSLDASNIHLLCENLTNQPLYTIHDCFATTPNNMEFIESSVKNAFIKIYFSSGNYLEKMHQNMMDQIKSYATEFSTIDGKEYVTIDNKDYLLPTLPKSFVNKEMVDIFIKGIQKSKFFIS